MRKGIDDRHDPMSRPLQRVCDRILRFVAGRAAGATRDEIFGETKGRYATKLAALKTLLESGTILRSGDGVRDSAFIYRRAPQCTLSNVVPARVAVVTEEFEL